MAIFSINDSSLGEYLNEHGGAHRRYAKMIADKDKKLKNREEAFGNIGTNAAKEKVGEASKKRMHLVDRNREYITTDNDASTYYVSDAYDTRKKNEKSGKSKSNNYSFNYGEAKENFKRDFGGKSKKTINTNDRKPGTYLAAQKKLREAAEYILSVLDESEKKME